MPNSKSKSRQNARVRWFKLGQRRCPCCGVQLVYNQGQPNTATFEHLVPACQGGTYEPFNALIVCTKCNNKRGNRCWIRWVEQHNMPKKEWLIQKYLEAIIEYRDAGRHIKVKAKSKARAEREICA